jgi:hypothetical protein
MIVKATAGGIMIFSPAENQDYELRRRPPQKRFALKNAPRSSFDIFV